MRRLSKDQQTVALLVTAVGAAMLVGAAFTDRFMQGFLLNVGSAFLLALPLLYVQRTMERSASETRAAVTELRTEVQQTQDEVRQSLDEMRAEVRRRDADRRTEQAAAVDQVAAAPSATTVEQALRVASTERAVSDRGMRVRIDPGVYVYVRFSIATDALLEVTVERRDGERIAELLWSEPESAADLVLRIAEKLRAASLHPGDTFDGADVFTGLQHAIATAREVKDRFSLIDNMEGAQELCGDQWMIYDWGLGGWIEERLDPYPIPVEDLSKRELEQHMGDKPWVDMPQFRSALTTARLLNDAGRLPG